MRVWLALVCCVFLALPAAGAASGDTSLTAIVRPKGAGTGGEIVRTLRCDPAGGNVPRAAAACRVIAAAGRRAFLATPPGTACTEIYGGPAVALVTGELDGRRIWARFSRESGCEITRWQRLVLLLGRAGFVR